MTNALLINPTAMEAGLLAAAAARAQPNGASLAEAFARTGLPHRRIEGWKWTDLRAALRDPIAASTEAVMVAPSIFKAAGAFEIEIVNGRGRRSEAALPGVRIRAVSAGEASATATEHPTALLAAALAEERLEFDVDGAVERPILIRRIARQGAHHARASIVLKPGASATMIESFEGEGSYFSNSATDVVLGDGACLTRLVLQDGAAEGVEVSVWAATLGKNARFEQTALLFGAKAARIETLLSCVGEGAQTSLAGVACLSEGRHADSSSRVEHRAEGCKTRQIYKQAIRDRAQGVFQGKFYVARGAQRTDAQMRAATLLLSPGAEAAHKPELEIYADDVQCAHGSSAGALDADALFYLRSRGLAEPVATALLIEAFVGEAIAGIAHVGLEEAFRARLYAWLGGP